MTYMFGCEERRKPLISNSIQHWKKGFHFQIWSSYVYMWSYNIHVLRTIFVSIAASRKGEIWWRFTKLWCGASMIHPHSFLIHTPASHNVYILPNSVCQTDKSLVIWFAVCALLFALQLAACVCSLLLALCSLEFVVCSWQWQNKNEIRQLVSQSDKKYDSNVFENATRSHTSSYRRGQCT